MADASGSDAGKSTHRSRGPWMLKSVGMWGTGKRSAFDVDVFIVDLGRKPEDDPRLPDGPVASTFITEDVEPQDGFDVQMGGQVLRCEDEEWVILNVD